ncbi:DUF2939 domain-containing protein [Microvirga alba]|uniref:DUF2939 domain-containing protein n=1 Tax=Microvirga alba TaxID=2791025 RepID=A0A931BM53_9HYPH|nr:DUF2939 domain-containing protein [Microvirga alba]MBF9232044.1 DUF2939 domain-containing protein [Microvirga alba]
MAWTLRVSFLLFLAWALFIMSPFVALYDLAKSVEARDIARIEERVNFRALRTSLSRQILNDYLKMSDEQPELSLLNNQTAANVGSVALDPLIENLVTPHALVDFLNEGRFANIAESGSAILLPLRLDARSLRHVAKLFVASESQGFRSISMAIPAGEPKDKRFRLTFRLSGGTWRLTGLDLPQALRAQMLQKLTRVAG